MLFPTFGLPLGFALGVSGFSSLALFTAMAGHLGLQHHLPTLVFGCAAMLPAMLAGLLLKTALPTLPFIALSFVRQCHLPLQVLLRPPRHLIEMLVSLHRRYEY